MMRTSFNILTYIIHILTNYLQLNNKSFFCSFRVTFIVFDCYRQKHYSHMNRDGNGSTHWLKPKHLNPIRVGYYVSTLYLSFIAVLTFEVPKYYESLDSVPLEQIGSWVGYC